MLLAGLSMLAAGAAQAEEFGFRGAELGILLSDFKRVPYPDGLGDPDRKSVELFCTGEGTSSQSTFFELTMSDEGAKDAGVIRCAYYYYATRRGPYAPRLGEWESAYTQFGDLGKFRFYYDFIPDASGEMRLMQISATMDQDNYDKAVDLLTAKWGTPDQVKVSEVRNRIGTGFPSRVTTWRKPDSRIVFEERTWKVDISEVTYSSRTLSAALGEARKRRTAGAVDKM